MDRQTDGQLTVASPRSALASRGNYAITTTFHLMNQSKQCYCLLYTHEPTLKEDADITEDTSCNIFFNHKGAAFPY